MNYKIIEPKTVYTVRLESGTNEWKCDMCKNSFAYDWNIFPFHTYTCKLESCYREFDTETEAREWLDKVNEIEKSIDDGLLIAAGEKLPLNCETCKGCDCLDCPEGD